MRLEAVTDGVAGDRASDALAIVASSETPFLRDA